MENASDQFFLCLKGGTSEVVEKRSRFLGRTEPVRSEEEALAFIERMKRENRDARHNCSAYIAGQERIEKCSDDGEPAKTAGLPMLDLLRKKHLTGVCVVVTRYFGGILLGTGGLVRAYSQAAAEAIDHSAFAAEERGLLTEWAADYASFGALKRLAELEQIPVLDIQYGQEVVLKLLIPREKTERFLSAVRERSAGKLSPRRSREVLFCAYEGSYKIL